jgi:hypothetical protein
LVAHSFALFLLRSGGGKEKEQTPADGKYRGREELVHARKGEQIHDPCFLDNLRWSAA